MQKQSNGIGGLSDASKSNPYEIRNDPNTRNGFGCYHPSNFQSRHFTSSKRNAHFVDARVGLEPDVRAAFHTLQHNLDWVAVQEFYQESKCLLYYRLLTGNYSSYKDDAHLDEYLETACRCDHDVADARPDVHHVQHHARGKRSTMIDLPADVLDKIATLTVSDSALFSAHVRDFVAEVVWLEDQLERQVLCDAALAQVEPELRYLGWSITELYHSTKEQQQCDP